MIKLFDQPDYKWYILPSASLRELVIRRILAKYPKFNYVLTYKDVDGFGVQICHADWVQPGQVYHCR